MENTNGEQLTELTGAQEVIAQNNNQGEDSSSVGSSDSQDFGKFKSADALLSAYNNLEAEFTRKCQKLSEIEKQASKQEPEKTTPIYSEKDWNNRVADFVQKNADAKSFASEISSYIMENPNIANSPNALDLAWAQIMKKNYVVPSKVVEDENFVSSYILSNDKIKQKIVEDYLKNIKQNKIPQTISGSIGGGAIEMPKFEPPKSMSEAKAMVAKMFSN